MKIQGLLTLDQKGRTDPDINIYFKFDENKEFEKSDGGVPKLDLKPEQSFFLGQ